MMEKILEVLRCERSNGEEHGKVSRNREEGLEEWIDGKEEWRLGWKERGRECDRYTAG